MSEELTHKHTQKMDIVYPATPTPVVIAHHDGEAHHGYISEKQRYLARLKRVEGQIRGLQRMIDEDQYCIDILTQVSAMTSALRSVALGLLDEHLQHCVVRAAAEGGEEADAKLHEASQAIARLVRS